MQAINSLVHRLGIYHRLKYSWAFDLIRAKSQVVQDRRRELNFYRDLLTGFKRGDLIFDIGANIGQKTYTFLKLGAQVLAVDPDPANQRVLRQSFTDFRLRQRVVVVDAAVGAEPGLKTLFIDEPGSAVNTLSPKWAEALQNGRNWTSRFMEFSQIEQVQMVTLEDLIRWYGRPFYIKIDVEGYESEVLAGLATAVPFVSFEVNLPQFRAEALECVEHLERIIKGGLYNYAPQCDAFLAARKWWSKDQFIHVLQTCENSALEVFWQAP